MAHERSRPCSVQVVGPRRVARPRCLASLPVTSIGPTGSMRYRPDIPRDGPASVRRLRRACNCFILLTSHRAGSSAIRPFEGWSSPPRTPACELLHLLGPPRTEVGRMVTKIAGPLHLVSLAGRIVLAVPLTLTRALAVALSTAVLATTLTTFSPLFSALPDPRARRRFSGRD